jgi:hypothetical protein
MIYYLLNNIKIKYYIFYIYMKINSKIYDSIIISSCLVGSVYIFSNSFKITNELFLYNKNCFMLDTINTISTVISGSIFIYGITKLKNL